MSIASISPKHPAGKAGNIHPQRRAQPFIKQAGQPQDSVKFGSHDTHATTHDAQTTTEVEADHEAESYKPTPPKQSDESFFKKLTQSSRWKAAAKVGWAAAKNKDAVWSDIKWSSILALVTCWMAGAQIIFIPIITATGFMFRAVTGAMQGFQHPELADIPSEQDKSTESGEAQTK